MTDETCEDTMQIAVCGAHMRGLPLNAQLTDRGAAFIRDARTAAEYRLFLLDRPAPARPGLLRGANGRSISLEIWKMPLAEVGGFLQAIPAPLGLGKIALADGSTVAGFLCEAYATKEAPDITLFAGWRQFLERSI